MPRTNDYTDRINLESAADLDEQQSGPSREHAGFRTLADHFDWRAIYGKLHCPVPDGRKVPDQTNENSDDQYRALLEKHPDITVEDDGRGRFTYSAMLDVLAEMDIPPEDRPHRERLAAISTPARAVTMSELNENLEEYEPASVEIVATPEELRAHMELHIERRIERKIEQGELERVNGGEE